MEWLRLYVSTLDNPKVQGLPAASSRHGRTASVWRYCTLYGDVNGGPCGAGMSTPHVLGLIARCSDGHYRVESVNLRCDELRSHQTCSGIGATV